MDETNERYIKKKEHNIALARKGRKTHPATTKAIKSPAYASSLFAKTYFFHLLSYL
jgi:hypothetical protein